MGPGRAAAAGKTHMFGKGSDNNNLGTSRVLVADACLPPPQINQWRVSLMFPQHT